MFFRTLGCVVALLLSVCQEVNCQRQVSYSFITAGHAYGSHDGDNIGLHPPLLERLYSGIDSTAEFIVFTGDIVNHSNVESWQQVDLEMDSVGIPSYYVMGNHDNNEAGRAVFEEKHGATYYTFYSHGDLFVVLNSIEADRAISENQLAFLQDQIDLAADSTGNIFIFFHELIWNSHEKYIGVRSNSRSRYDQVVEHSNYWEEVHPMLLERPQKDFYLIAGDVGGNPDAISAFYDRWDHITLLASGMGEVDDENFLLVHVIKGDSTEFELAPLNADLNLPGTEYYSVPGAPDDIAGPGFVFQGSNSVEYSVPEVFNADSYQWYLPPGVTGSSSRDQIELEFDMNFEYGELSVRASRDGFGSGTPTSRTIQADFTSIESLIAQRAPLGIEVREESDVLHIQLEGLYAETFSLRIMDSGGRVLISKQVMAPDCCQEFQIFTSELPRGILIISASTKTRQVTEKIVIR